MCQSCKPALLHARHCRTASTVKCLAAHFNDFKVCRLDNPAGLVAVSQVPQLARLSLVGCHATQVLQNCSRCCRVLLCCLDGLEVAHGHLSGQVVKHLPLLAPLAPTLSYLDMSDLGPEDRWAGWQQNTVLDMPTAVLHMTRSTTHQPPDTSSTSMACSHTMMPMG